MRLEATYEADDLVIFVDVAFDPGAPVQTLTGAALEALAGRGSEVVPATATLLAPDRVEIRIARDLLRRGMWQLQLRAEAQGLQHTIWAGQIPVNRSLRLAQNP